MRTKWTILMLVTALFVELHSATADGATARSNIATVQATQNGSNRLASADSEVGTTQGSYIGDAKPVLCSQRSFGVGHGRFDHEPKYYYYDHGYPYHYYYWPHIRPYMFWPYYHGWYFGYHYYK
jgi:hypothetical protein